MKENGVKTQDNEKKLKATMQWNFHRKRASKSEENGEILYIFSYVLVFVCFRRIAMVSFLKLLKRNVHIRCKKIKICSHTGDRSRENFISVYVVDEVKSHVCTDTHTHKHNPHACCTVHTNIHWQEHQQQQLEKKN